MPDVQLILILATISVLIPVIVGLFCFRRLSFELRLLLGLLIFASVIEIFGTYRASMGKSSLWPYHIYGPVELLIFFAIFSRWQYDLVVKKIIVVLGIAGLAFYLINSFFIDDKVILWINGRFLFDDWAGFNYLPIRVIDVIYVAMAAYTLVDLVIRDRGDIIGSPVFWVSAGLLLFSSAAIILFVSMGISRSKFFFKIWVFNNVINIIANQFYAIGFIIGFRKKAALQSEAYKSF